MKGQDLLKKIKLEEYKEKASILEREIRFNQEDIGGLEERRKSLIESLKDNTKRLYATKAKQKDLLEKDVASVELPKHKPCISGIDFGPSLHPAFNCRCVTLPKKYVGSLEYGAPTYVAGERIEAGQLVTYDNNGVLMKTRNYDGFGRLVKT